MLLCLTNPWQPAKFSLPCFKLVSWFRCVWSRLELKEDFQEQDQVPLVYWLLAFSPILMGLDYLEKLCFIDVFCNFQETGSGTCPRLVMNQSPFSKYTYHMSRAMQFICDEDRLAFALYQSPDLTNYTHWNITLSLVRFICKRITSFGMKMQEILWLFINQIGAKWTVFLSAFKRNCMTVQTSCA